MRTDRGPYAQTGHRLRFDWGPIGADTVGPGSTIVAVIDVLSFTTSLSVAVEKGIEVFPYQWKDESAIAFARSHDAVIAGNRSDTTAVSLSPASIRRSQGIQRLVLPSPNGSAISQRLSAQDTTVIGVCLRNASAAAQWVTQRVRNDPSAVVSVIAEGERWRGEGSLRPSFEDMLGAGAFLHRLPFSGSPEAQAAIAVYAAAAGRIPELLHDCASGRELIAEGYPADVAIAAEVDSCTVVPLLSGARYVAG